MIGYESILYLNQSDKSSANNTSGYDVLSKNIINTLVNESSKVTSSLLSFVEKIDKMNIFSKEKMLFRTNKASLIQIESAIDNLNKFLIHH